MVLNSWDIVENSKVFREKSHKSQETALISPVYEWNTLYSTEVIKINVSNNRQEYIKVPPTIWLQQCYIFLGLEASPRSHFSLFSGLLPRFSV